MDFHLRRRVEALPSFIKDTTDYLQKMAALNPLPPNTTLVTMDVTSLYTNIPHSDGIEACKEIRVSRSVKVSPIDCLVTMFTMVLKKNNFTFNGDQKNLSLPSTRYLYLRWPFFYETQLDQLPFSVVQLRMRNSCA